MNQRLLAIIRIGIGGTFVAAALLKLANVDAFAEEVANYRLMPAGLIPHFVCAVLGTEFVAGAALVIGAKEIGRAHV